MILTDDQKLIVGLFSARIFIVKSITFLKFNRVHLTTIRKNAEFRIWGHFDDYCVFWNSNQYSGYKKGQSHINNHLSLSLTLNNSWKFEDICFRFYVASLTSGLHSLSSTKCRELSAAWERCIFGKLTLLSLSCY